MKSGITEAQRLAHTRGSHATRPVSDEQAITLMGSINLLPIPGNSVSIGNVKLHCELPGHGYGDYYLSGRLNDVADVMSAALSGTCVNHNSIQVEPYRQFDPDVNVMQQDAHHMGSTMGTNAKLLFSTFPSDNMDYLIVVNTRTGQSVKLTFKDS